MALIPPFRFLRQGGVRWCLLASWLYERTSSQQADRAAQVLTDPDVVVVPIVAVHAAQVPRGKVVVQGVPVVAAWRLPSLLRQLPAVLGPERVAVLADRLGSASTPPPDSSGRPSGSPPYCWRPGAVSKILDLAVAVIPPRPQRSCG